MVFFFCKICQIEYIRYGPGEICCTCGDIVRNNHVFLNLKNLKNDLNNMINNAYYYKKKGDITLYKYNIKRTYIISKEIYSFRTFFKI